MAILAKAGLSSFEMAYPLEPKCFGDVHAHLPCFACINDDTGRGQCQSTKRIPSQLPQACSCSICVVNLMTIAYRDSSPFPMMMSERMGAAGIGIQRAGKRYTNIWYAGTVHHFTA